MCLGRCTALPAGEVRYWKNWGVSIEVVEDWLNRSQLGDVDVVFSSALYAPFDEGIVVFGYQEFAEDNLDDLAVFYIAPLKNRGM